ncbi:sugar ABC transporter substrate-binding protein [Actinophytocola sp.]|uniref:sugar ABC transporter substrate-binding protein n=1 Tax=Actinophytocola sp. TaxID=1872138 RepID=UPI002ED4FF8D
MAWLDRDRTPVRFTVTTSVASGLILAAILNAFRGGITDSIGLLWLVLTFAGSATATWLATSTYYRVRKQSRAFLVTSAFSQKYHIAAFVQRLHSALDRDGIDLVLKVPDRDYDASAQSHHLNRLLSRRRDYLGGVVVVTEANRSREDLLTFSRRSRLPVVFTDCEPFEKEVEYPPNTAFVGYDTGEIGELAGRWLVERLRGREHPRVLIVASREHAARQERCEQALRAGLENVAVTIDDRCEFTRSRSYAAVRTHVRQLDAGQCLAAIFCTNDEMALGAVDALRSASLPATKETLVVGVDGVLEATTLIDTADSPLRATVVQDTHRLAVSIVDFLQKMRRGSDVPKRVILPAEIHEAT